MGVPEMSTRRGVFKLLRAWYVWLSEFFSRCPWEKKRLKTKKIIKHGQKKKYFLKGQLAQGNYTSSIMQKIGNILDAQMFIVQSNKLYHS